MFKLQPDSKKEVLRIGGGTLVLSAVMVAVFAVFATLRLVGQDQKPFWTLSLGGTIEQSWTLRGGKATVEGVPAGQWLLVAEAPNGRVWHGAVATSGTGEVAVSLE